MFRESGNSLSRFYPYSRILGMDTPEYSTVQYSTLSLCPLARVTPKQKKAKNKNKKNKDRKNGRIQPTARGKTWRISRKKQNKGVQIINGNGRNNLKLNHWDMGPRH